jgi:hypothetical protein
MSIDAVLRPEQPESSAMACDKLGSQIYFVLGGLQFDRPAVVKAVTGILQSGHLLGLEWWNWTK